LAIHANSTRRARWHQKLGFVKHPFVISISKFVNDGGTAPCIDVVVSRIFPQHTVETLADGKKLTLSFTESEKAQVKWQQEFQKLWDKLERGRVHTKTTYKRYNLSDVEGLDGEELYQLMLTASNESEFTGLLSKKQREQVQDCAQYHKRQEQMEISNDITEEIEVLAY
jgi:hypothetical protein